MVYVIVRCDDDKDEASVMHAHIEGIKAANKLLKAYKFYLIEYLCEDSGISKKEAEEHFEMYYGKNEGDACTLKRVNMWGLPHSEMTMMAIPLKEHEDIGEFLKSWDGRSMRNQEVRDSFDMLLSGICWSRHTFEV